MGNKDCNTCKGSGQFIDLLAPWEGIQTCDCAQDVLANDPGYDEWLLRLAEQEDERTGRAY